MTLEQLRDYTFRIGKSPAAVFKAANDWGGWAHVFPIEATVTPKPKYGLSVGDVDIAVGKFPEAQSRVRNFFNITPKYLTLLSQAEARLRTAAIKGLRKSGADALTYPFSGQVYVDESRRYWFQMTAAGAVYHYPGKVDASKIYDAFKSGQLESPVFKLVSPDENDGSMEIVLKNNIGVRRLKNGLTVMARRETIGDVGGVTSIVTDIVWDEIYRGSYNYAETATNGIVRHEHCDVKPHSERKGFYVNPPEGLSLENRRFGKLTDLKDPGRKAS